MKSKRIAQITTFTSLAIFGVVMFGRTMTDPLEDSMGGPQAGEAIPNDTARRRIRTGPRTPPRSHSISDQTVHHVPNEDEIPDELTGEEPDLDDNESEDLAVYLEHLEVLDNPNVDELTMLGELAFEANEASAAYDHYLEVIDHHTDHPLAPFALYKLAWTEFNLGDVDAAIADMELMLEWLEVGESPMEDTLRNAGPTDLAMFIDKSK